MFIIVGLGNPGMQYAGTRHNIGFDTITRLCDDYKISMNIKKHKAVCGKGVIAGQKVLLAMPQTYMNNSGESVRELVDFYKVEPEELIIIYDDISLDVGQLRIRAKGSAGGHNGIKSIIQYLGSENFPRIKVGVGEKPAQMDLADYVLGHFLKEEQPMMQQAFQDGAAAVVSMITEGVDAAMNHFNGAARGETKERQAKVKEERAARRRAAKQSQSAEPQTDESVQKEIE